MANDPLSPELLAERILAAEARKARALAEFEAAKAELAWLREGERLFGGGSREETPLPPQEPGAKVTELFPDPSIFVNGLQPTLRQAIVYAMLGSNATHFRVGDLVDALDQRGWLPEHSNPQKRVSDMAGEMVQEGQLERAGRGTYALSPELAAQLEAARVGQQGMSPA